MLDAVRQRAYEELSKGVEILAPHKGRCRVCRRPLHGLFHFHNELKAIKIYDLDGPGGPPVERVVRDKKFTQVGRNSIVDAFDAGVGFTLSNYNYHGSGTGGGAEADTETALVTEVETPRGAGTQSQPTADVYRSIQTHTYAGGFTIVEHGLFDQAASGGNLLDRTLFGGIAVVASDKIEFTFDLTISSEA
jgi:hypothetical protein